MRLHLVYTAMLIVFLLTLFAYANQAAAYKAQTIEVKATVVSYNGESKNTVNCLVDGLTSAPNGLFAIVIENKNTFKSILYREMICTIKYETQFLILKPTTRLLVINYGANKSAIGFIEKMNHFPMSPLKIKITNSDKNKGPWNYLSCTIK